MTASTGNVPGRIFMSYRREDTDYPAGWLYDRLAGHFARSQVFKDIDSIELGDDFVEEITTAVGSCDVLLALIGNRWLTVTDQDGRRRLDNLDDFVRLEIEAALARNVRVIPILVEGARMPRADELPASLSKLARRQALELSPSRFDVDTGRLLRVLERTITETQERARKQAEEAARRQAEETARRQAEETARRQAEETARRQAEETARRQAEETAQREAEETARRQAEETAQREAEETARRQAEETARREAEETARRQAEETARREAEETARRQAEETAQREAEETARRQAEETAQREAEETARRQAEEAAQRKAEETARRQAEEAAQRKAEETARRQAEETAQRKAEETARRQAEEAAQRKAEETARRQAEETAQRKAEETARRQAEEAAQRKAEETARRQAEEAAQRKAEETARRQAETVPAAVRPDEPAGEPDLLTTAAGTDVLAPVQPGLPNPGPATALVEPQPAGTLPAKIPPPRAGPSEPPTVRTLEPAPGGGLPYEDGGTPSPAVAAVAGNGMPAAAATAATDHPLASTLETAAGSGDSTGELGRLTVPVSGGDGAPPVQRPPRRRGLVTAWIRRHRLPVFALACATLAAAVTVPLISSSPPSPSISARPAAIGFGWVSLGNLSETPSLVDVYLYSSGSSSPQFVQHRVAYGKILPYHAVNAGDYTAKVRAAGASASSNPVWSVSLIVRAGGAYTVAPLRATAQQGQLKVIDNDLTAPSGKSLVRVIQADLNQGQVTFHCSCAAGVPGNLTTDAAPGSVSPQKHIPTGTWTMTATGPGAKTSLPVALTDGTVHNEIVISKPGGGIEIINLVQAPPSFRRVPVDLPSSLGTSLIASVAFSPSGATLAIPAAKICLWDIAAKDCTMPFGNASPYSLAFSPDGKTLAGPGGIDSASTYLWNVATGSRTGTLPAPNPGVYTVAFTHNGKLLAVGDGNGHTYLWDVTTRKLIFPFTDPGPKGVNSVAFSPDDKILAVGEQYGHTDLWDVATRKLIFSLSDPGTKGVMSVAFSPDGKLLVAGDSNGHTYLWDVTSGKLIVALPNPGTKSVTSVACSPDNTTMAAAGSNGSIYIWNVRNGKLLATLADPNKTVIGSVAFSPDGQVLTAGDNNGSVFLWYKS